MDDTELAALKARSDGGIRGGFYPDDAYAVIDDLIEDLIAARATIRDLPQTAAEEAATLCEARANAWGNDRDEAFNEGCIACATAIRARASGK